MRRSPPVARSMSPAPVRTMRFAPRSTWPLSPSVAASRTASGSAAAVSAPDTRRYDQLSFDADGTSPLAPTSRLVLVAVVNPSDSDPFRTRLPPAREREHARLAEVGTAVRAVAPLEGGRGAGAEVPVGRQREVAVGHDLDAGPQVEAVDARVTEAGFDRGRVGHEGIRHAAERRKASSR